MFSQVLLACSNRLEGRLSSEVEQLPMLTHLALSHNLLTGLPDTISNLTSLTDLSLDHNQVHNMTNLSESLLLQLSRVPSQLAQLSALQLLNLAANRLGAILCNVPN